jgi:hypothetical protein
MFEKLTLKSVLNQRYKNFEYIVFFCEDVFESKDIERIKNISGITPIFLSAQAYDAQRDFVPVINSKLRDSSHVVITKLDCDDMIHADYLSTIFDTFDPKKLDMFCFRIGYYYCQGSNYIFSKKAGNSSPIFTLIEKCNSNINARNDVFSYDHNELFKKYSKYSRKLSSPTNLWLKYQHAYTIGRVSDQIKWNYDYKKLGEYMLNVVKKKRMKDNPKTILSSGESNYCCDMFGISCDDLMKSEWNTGEENDKCS